MKREDFLGSKSWIRTEDYGHLAIVTTHITNIWIKQTTVNARQTHNSKLDGFEHHVSPREIIRSELLSSSSVSN